MELMDQHVNINGSYSYTLLTDAVNNYFTRDEHRGFHKFVWLSKDEKTEEKLIYLVVQIYTLENVNLGSKYQINLMLAKEKY